MEMYLWNSAIVLSKLLFYLGFAAATGYTFFVYSKSFTSRSAADTELSAYRRLTISILAVAFMANIVGFFATTGAMAEDGIRGAMDPAIVAMMWSTATGDTALMRGIGLIAALLILLLPMALGSTKKTQGAKHLIMMTAVLLLAYSFVQLGHISERGWLNQALLMFHVFVMAWWFGALFPLKLACRSFSDEKLVEVMESFGKQAVYMVISSILAGVIMAVELIDSLAALFESSYGLTLLIKVVLVISILGIAATNKLKRVPSIKDGTGRRSLSRSISIEIMVACSILLVTAALTSVVYPASS
ncbi:CopD family protein [Lacimicrobium sp. SS2-24]|uniref:copper resistance D family protein n=1 Tax=Lacimicrobium sp. SS2-24 TaxID=2005569 RepID=UPI000B4ADC05|nr:CopD family protein [Lacimicrobium sp. SS2-24]